MDTNQPPQTPQAKKFNGLLFLEVGLIEVFSVIVILLLIFSTLNYFNILPISESFPFLSFLPQRQKIITNKTVKTNIQQKANKPLPMEISRTIPIVGPTIGCPVEQNLCTNSVTISESKENTASFSAVAYNLKQGTSIISAINGDIELKNEDIKGQMLLILTIVNKSRNIKVNYEFEINSFRYAAAQANKTGQGKVLGEIVGKESLNQFGNKFNLIFSIQNLNALQYLKIKPSPDGKGILDIGF